MEVDWREFGGLSSRCVGRGYCQARKRLPLDTLQRLRVAVAAAGQKAATLWHGLLPKVIDATTVGLPDTPKNQRAYRPKSVTLVTTLLDATIRLPRLTMVLGGRQAPRGRIKRYKHENGYRRWRDSDLNLRPEPGDYAER
jgi:hypothetical protein